MKKILLLISALLIISGCSTPEEKAKQQEIQDFFEDMVEDGRAEPVAPM